MLEGEGMEQTEVSLEEPQEAGTAAAPENEPTAAEVAPAEQPVSEAPPAPKPRRARKATQQESAALPEPDAESVRPEEEIVSLPRSTLQARLEQARSAEAAKYADYEVLKAQAVELQALKDAHQAESNQQAEELQQTRERAAGLEREAREARVRALIVSRAAGLGFADPEGDVYPQVVVTLTPDESGGIPPEAVDQALQDLAQRKPYLRGAVAPPLSVVNGSRQTSVPHRSDEQRRFEYFGGRTDHFWGV
jgi:hypothetical protein